MARGLHVPVEVSEKTYAVLSAADAEAFECDRAVTHALHKDGQPLTTPTGIILSGPTLMGKLTQLQSHYSEKAPFFVKRMNQAQLDNHTAISAGLERAGVATERVLSSHPSFQGVREALAREGIELEPRAAPKARAGEHFVLIPRSGESLFGLMMNRTVGRKEILAYLETLGRIHSTGMAHNHPHLNNFFRSGARVGVHDYSLATFHTPDWRDAHSVFRAFQNDYDHALQIWIRAATDAHNREMTEELQKKWVGEYLRALTKHLPAKPRVKRELEELLHAYVYSSVLPFLRRHGYFKHKGVEL